MPSTRATSRRAIVDAVQKAPNHKGDITLADLAGYRVKEREPLCFPYRRYRICSMGPPSSGGLAVAQISQADRAVRPRHNARSRRP